MGDALRGIDFRAVVRLSDRADVTLALPGESCARVPSTSLPWLLSSGRIVPVDAPPSPAAGRRRARGATADDCALEDVGLTEKDPRR